jgi:hypothetical protein
MNLSKESLHELEAFPQVLRQLLQAELAAGNEIVELNYGFPAPPAGAWIKLAKPLCSRPQSSGDGIIYYDRNFPNFSGEITDAKRFYFLLEPPHPPEPEPPFNAPGTTPSPKSGSTSDLVQRFRDSMAIDYNKWHDGIGYDVGLLSKASPEELREVEAIMLQRGILDWRDVEAFAVFHSPAARMALRRALKGSDESIRAAVLNYAPEIVSEDERCASLISALETAEIFGGLTQTLLQVEDFHPPLIVDALLRGTLRRDGTTAVNFAAMLMFLHGKAASAFDWEQRPFFLKFQTEDAAQRAAAFRELCEKIGANAGRFLPA